MEEGKTKDQRIGDNIVDCIVGNTINHTINHTGNKFEINIDDDKSYENFNNLYRENGKNIIIIDDKLTAIAKIPEGPIIRDLNNTNIINSPTVAVILPINSLFRRLRPSLHTKPQDIEEFIKDEDKSSKAQKYPDIHKGIIEFRQHLNTCTNIDLYYIAKHIDNDLDTDEPPKPGRIYGDGKDENWSGTGSSTNNTRSYIIDTIIDYVKYAMVDVPFKEKINISEKISTIPTSKTHEIKETWSEAIVRGCWPLTSLITKYSERISPPFLNLLDPIYKRQYLKQYKKPDIYEEFNKQTNQIPFAIPTIETKDAEEGTIQAILSDQEINIKNEEKDLWEKSPSPEEKTICDNHPLVLRKEWYNQNQGNCWEFTQNAPITAIGGFDFDEGEGVEILEAHRKYVQEILKKNPDTYEYHGLRKLCIPISFLLKMFLLDKKYSSKQFNNDKFDLAKCYSKSLYFTNRQVGIKGVPNPDNKAPTDHPVTIKYIRGLLTNLLTRIHMMLRKAADHTPTAENIGGNNLTVFWAAIFTCIIRTNECEWRDDGHGVPLRGHKLIEELMGITRSGKSNQTDSWKEYLNSSMYIVFGDPKNATRAFNLNEMDNNTGGQSVYKKVGTGPVTIINQPGKGIIPIL